MDDPQFTGAQRRRLRKDLAQRGFVKARYCFYHPAHWRVELAPQPDKNSYQLCWDDPEHDALAEAGEVYDIFDEGYFPLTNEARAWIAQVNQELAEMERQDALNALHPPEDEDASPVV